MSDSSQGPGWWLASDGKWYPPSGAVPPVPPGPPQQPPLPSSGPEGWQPAQPSAGATPLSPAGPGAEGASEGAAPWYFSLWLIVPLLFCCAPLGLVLLWVSHHPKNLKIGLTAATAVLVVVGGIVSLGASPAEDSTSTTAVPTTPAPSTTAAPSTTVPTTTTAPPTTLPPPTLPPTTAATIPSGEINQAALDLTWSRLSVEDRTSVCQAIDLLGLNGAAALIVDGADGAFTIEEVKVFLTRKC